jgi:Protein of unknown function (DUF3015)
MIFKSTIVALGLLLSSQLWAAGDSGCGLGSVIINKNSKGMQLLSLTTNGSFSSQVLGITFGTSNCSASGIVSNDQEIENYVKVNQPDIIKEMAMGQGEKVLTLASFYGCTSPASQKQFINLTKQHFSEINEKANSDAKTWMGGLKAVLESHQDLISDCHAS